MGSLQDAARFRTPERSYLAKYPGQVGTAVRSLTAEVMTRLEGKRSPAAAPQAAVPAKPVEDAKEPSTV